MGKIERERGEANVDYIRVRIVRVRVVSAVRREEGGIVA